MNPKSLLSLRAEIITEVPAPRTATLGQIQSWRKSAEQASGATVQSVGQDLVPPQVDLVPPQLEAVPPQVDLVPPQVEAVPRFLAREPLTAMLCY